MSSKTRKAMEQKFKASNIDKAGDVHKND